MDKMVINHLEKLFVTSDAGTILKELEVGISHKIEAVKGLSQKSPTKVGIVLNGQV